MYEDLVTVENENGTYSVYWSMNDLSCDYIWDEITDAPMEFATEQIAYAAGQRYFS